jgi:DMSO/TMAO reductase YedYZ molybdopterin-dependent catalytic subunit
MFDRVFGNRSPDPAQAGRVPPGQYLTEKFPVLHYGSVPRADLATWDLRVHGEVDNPLRLTWQEFRALPRKEVTTDIHCVTRWSKLDSHWEGVAIQTILELARAGRQPGSSSATRSRATPLICRWMCWTTTTSCWRTPTRAHPSSPSTGIPSG